MDKVSTKLTTNLRFVGVLQIQLENSNVCITCESFHQQILRKGYRL